MPGLSRPSMMPPGFVRPNPMARGGFFPSMQGYQFPLGATANKQYGAVPVEEEEEEQGKGAPDKLGLAHLSLSPGGGRRARIDLCQILLCALIPVAVYAVTAAALSFKLMYSLWLLACAIALLCLLPSVCAAFLGLKASREKESVQAKWMFFLCALCSVAWLIGVILGCTNYTTNTKPLYDMSGLNYYPQVDPSASAEGYIDAGRMLFQPGSQVDLSKAMGVRISNTYCVAPVVSKNHPKGKDVQYDYWAVGVGCCSSIQPQSDWTCPDVKNHRATGGMRLMEDGSRPYFRMAVQEAEATYKIRARHPIFIHWVEDPTGQMNAWSTAGPRLYWYGFFALLVAMFFLSLAAGLFFTRATMESHPCKGTGFVRYTTLNPDHDFVAEGLAEPTSTKSVTL